MTACHAFIIYLFPLEIGKLIITFFTGKYLKCLSNLIKIRTVRA